MALYEYQCDNGCRTIFSEFSETPSVKKKCPECGKMARRVYSPPVVKVAFKEGFHPGVDQYVGTQKELNRVMREKGFAKRDG